MRRGGSLPARPGPLPASLPGLSLEGQLVQTEEGTCFVVEQRYPLAYRHGHLALGDLLHEAPGWWSEWDPQTEPAGIFPEDWAFLDIETTGLGDGAGTYAFLVGLGRYEGDAFCLRQVFMRSPAEERAVLLTVAGLLHDRQALVSFNGRGFDIPVLRSRYTLARMPMPWQGQLHLDLLLPARRLWRFRLARCNLGTLEQELLGVERDLVDVPGWRIPSMYHEYLRGGDPELLKPVFYHNAQDILSLVTLSTRLARFLGDPWSEGGARHGLEFYALGRMFEQRAQDRQAIEAYRAALLLAMPVEARERAWERLSMLLKRQEVWDEAVEIWESLVERPGNRPLYAYVELAKYYEHHRQDPERAEAVTRRAIADHGECPSGDDLGHRLKRLCRKREQGSLKEKTE